MLGKAADSLLPLRRTERPLAMALLLHNLFAVGAFLTGRTVRDTLFLAHADLAALPWMYVASAVAVTMTGLWYSSVAAEFRRDRVAIGTAALFAVVFAGFQFWEHTHHPWVYPALYVVVEVMGALVLVQFWSLANDLFHAREAKRLYGIIGAGGTLANIFIGLLCAKISLWFGSSALIAFTALLLVGAAFAAGSAGAAGRQRLFARAAAGRKTATRRGGFSKVAESSHLKMVALLAGLTFITVTLVDYDFKVIARQVFGKDELAAFFGYFSAGVGVLALGLQLFGTSRLLSTAGVVASLAVLPLSLGIGSALFLAFPVLWAASLMKGADTLFRYSVNDATTQILYLPVPASSRVSAKAFIDGVVKPLAIGLAGVGLALYRSATDASPFALGWISVATCVAWLLVVAALRGQYIRSLQQTLRNQKLDLESVRHRVLDSATSGVLLNALQSEDPKDVLNALGLIPHLDDVEVDNRVEALLNHAMPAIRTAALEYYARRQTMRYANAIFKHFEDPEPSVRAAAIDAFCAIGKDKAVKNVEQFLLDRDPRVRSAAVVGMIRYGGLDGVLAAAGALKQLIAHQDSAMREHSARVLGAIGVRNFYQPVLSLMADPDVKVRRAAIMAAGALKSPEFVIPLIYRTQHAETLQDAVSALSAYGPSIVPTLGKVLANPLEIAAIRRAIARVLGRLGSREAVELICRHLDDRDETLRNRLYRALARAVKGRETVLTDRAPVEAALEAELRRAYLALLQAEVLNLTHGPGPDTPRSGLEAAQALLASGLQEKVLLAEKRMFSLLSVLYPDSDMEQISASIFDADAADAPRRRANAVELLDNLLGRELKKKVLPLLEDLPRDARLQLLAGLFDFPTKNALDTLHDLCRDESGWVRACAMWCLAQKPEADITELLAASVTDSQPVVREIALVLLEKASPDRAVVVAEKYLTDEAPSVRQQAALIATRHAARS